MASEDASRQRQIQHQELAQLCIANEWSKAIKILTTLLTHQPESVDLLCNRAFCHNKLELHKHALKDCDRALQIKPTAFQAYIHKGHALVGLGKHQDALQVWKAGYDSAVAHSGNIELLLELHMLMMKIQEQNSFAIKKNDLASASPPRSSSSCTPPKTPPRQSVQIDEKRKSPSRKDPHFVNLKPKKSNLISLDLRLSRGIGLVNSGQYQEAITIFDQVIQVNPNSVEALLGRGTAYAFQRNLDAAIIDFSEALRINPNTGEAWRRRGQARAALGASPEAAYDLTKALELDPNSSDILQERGTVHYRSKNYEGAVEDLKACVAIDPTNKLAFNFLGISLLAIGCHVEGINAYYKALEIDPNFKEGWTQLAQSFSELAKTDKAMECLEKALSIDDKYVNAYRLQGVIRQGQGDHRGAVKELSIALQLDPSNMECKYLRASCHHALGEYADAVKHYEAVLDMEFDSVDKCILQFLAFYQRVIALYTASKANQSFSSFNIDQDLHPSVKEAWCKRLQPTPSIFPFCFQQPVKESLKSGRIRGQDIVISKAKRSLLEFADKLGGKIQYDCPGFSRNKRMHRMAGLAALEIAQKTLSAWKAIRDPLSAQEKPNGPKSGKRVRRRENAGVSLNRGGICSSSDGSEFSPASSFYEEKSGLPLSWHDIYSIAVKWRQIAEPCDPVVWVNKLSEKEFNAGFGSHTPMLLGQTKVVRYYPNFVRAFGIMKKLMIESKTVYNAANNPVEFITKEELESIKGAESCSQLYQIVGEDFWVVTPCFSIAEDGKILDGTRLTMQKMGENGYDFSIRTPGTPPRWADYDREMTCAWADLCDVFCWEAYGSTDLARLENVRDCILKLTFYWYNFMPLARGTAAVGYITLLGLFLAAGMRVNANIPNGLQVDWEAILSSNVTNFIEAISRWLYPSVTHDVSWQNLPDVSSTFPTTGSVVAALSIYDLD